MVQLLSELGEWSSENDNNRLPNNEQIKYLCWSRHGDIIPSWLGVSVSGAVTIDTNHSKQFLTVWDQLNLNTTSQRTYNEGISPLRFSPSFLKARSHWTSAKANSEATSLLKRFLRNPIYWSQAATRIKDFFSLSLSSKSCSHTSALAFFFDLCHQMQTLSMNTIVRFHRTTPNFNENANTDVKCEQGFNGLSVFKTASKFIT